MNHSEHLNEIGAALAKAQGEMENAAKDKTNPHFRSKYADLGNVWDAIRAPLSKHGLSVIQLPFSDDKGQVHISTMLLHSSGQWIRADYALPATKPDAQGYGSAITYMKRYALTGIGVAPEDDDGNAASRGSGNGYGNSHGNGGDTITEQQTKTLRDMLASSNGDPEKFCRYFKIDAIPHLPASEYGRAVEALNTRLHPKPVKPSSHEH